MLNSKKWLSGICVGLCAFVCFSACNKATESAVIDDQVSLYLTDDPALFENVFIDIKYVEVKVQEGYKNVDHEGDKDEDDDDHFDDDDKDMDNDNKSRDRFGKWDTLQFTPGIYDILKLKNGVEALLGQTRVKGRVRKIRLTLGEKNSLVKAGVTYPLQLHAGINKYIYVRIQNRHHDRLSTNHIGIKIDFDISSSIIEINGKFYLKPLLKPFCEQQFGKVQGKVFPADAHPLVMIFNDQDKGVAIPEKSGEYKIRGLKAGTYKVIFKGLNGYADQTLTDIKVVKNKETKIQDVMLRK